MIDIIDLIEAVVFVVGVLLHFTLRKKVMNCYADEYKDLVDTKIALATLKKHWIRFFSMNFVTIALAPGFHLDFRNFIVFIPESREINPMHETGSRLIHGMNFAQSFMNNSIAIMVHQNATNSIHSASSTVTEIVNTNYALLEMVVISHFCKFGE
jgi:hypothetical protein